MKLQPTDKMLISSRAVAFVLIPIAYFGHAQPGPRELTLFERSFSRKTFSKFSPSDWCRISSPCGALETRLSVGTRTRLYFKRLTSFIVELFNVSEVIRSWKLIAFCRIIIARDFSEPDNQSSIDRPFSIKVINYWRNISYDFPSKIKREAENPLERWKSFKDLVVPLLLLLPKSLLRLSRVVPQSDILCMSCVLS